MGTVTRDDYAMALAKQAKVDFESHVILMNYDPPQVVCQDLHFLQMACEKLCKAHYYSNTGSIPKDIGSSHAHVASRLPIIIRDMLNRDPAVPNATRSVILRGARDFSREIELLAPSVDANGTRMDNCEYPWIDKAGHLRIPADYDFPTLRFLEKEFGRVFLQLIKRSINELTNT